jgi:hypothetical protein
MVPPADSLLSKDPTRSYRPNPTAFHPTLRDAILPGRSEGSSLGNHPRGLHRCDHLEPELLIAIKDQVFVRRFKGKCLAQLLDDPTASRMLRDVNVQDARPIMADDEEAVETPKVIVGTVKKSRAAMASRWFRRKASQRLARSGSLGVRFIQRETVLSERSKSSMRSSP